MLKGYLVYDKAGAERNAWFIDRFIEKAKELKINLTLAFSSCIKTLDLPDFAIVRCISPDINAYLEEKGVKVFNNFKTSEIANDKWKTYCMARSLNIRVMNTLKSDGDFEFPYVLKSVDGHGGQEVFMVNDAKEKQNALNFIKNKKSIIQQVCSDKGKDLRVYVLGKKILLSVLRTSKTDFKSNFSLGGNAQVKKAPIKCRRIIKRLYNELKFDFVGVDFIFHDSKPVLNEIEDPVGTRMVYKLTHVDPAYEYLKYIKKHLKKFRA